MVFRYGYPLARMWWRVRRPRHEAALVAVYVGHELLLLKSSYRATWNFPGVRLIRRGETRKRPRGASLPREVGLTGNTLVPAAGGSGNWGGRGFESTSLTCDWIGNPNSGLDQSLRSLRRGSAVIASGSSPTTLAGCAASNRTRRRRRCRGLRRLVHAALQQIADDLLAWREKAPVAAAQLRPKSFVAAVRCAGADELHARTGASQHAYGVSHAPSLDQRPPMRLFVYGTLLDRWGGRGILPALSRCRRRCMAGGALQFAAGAIRPCAAIAAGLWVACWSGFRRVRWGGWRRSKVRQYRLTRVVVGTPNGKTAAHTWIAPCGTRRN